MEKNSKKSENGRFKALKIYKKYFKSFGFYIVLPEIRFCGKWLQNLGFFHGEK